MNKYKPHVIVVPEDDANRQLANGFILDPGLNSTCIDIRPPAGGWVKVKEAFLNQHVPELRRFHERHLVLLIDFDDQVVDRTETFRSCIPEDVEARVYVLGTRGEPEPLRKAFGKSLEQIGSALARDCSNATTHVWSHAMLLHNVPERGRLLAEVRPFLFV